VPSAALSRARRMSAPPLSVAVNGVGTSGTVHSPRVPGSPRHQQYMANVMDAGTCATELSAEAVRRTPLTSCPAAFGSLSLCVLQVCATPAARRSWTSSSSTGWPWRSRRSWCVAEHWNYLGQVSHGLNDALPLCPPSVHRSSPCLRTRRPVSPSLRLNRKERRYRRPPRPR